MDSCQEIKKISGTEIEKFLMVEEKNELVTRIHNIKECNKVEAIPYLKKYLDDIRITHILQYKGMTIGSVTKGAITELQNLK